MSRAAELQARRMRQGLAAARSEVARLQSELSSALAKLELLDDHRRADSELIDRLTSERDEARANYQWMVERAADQRLDGYRELGARAAAAENERDEARARCRTAAQILIAEIGASGPESVEETARRAVERIQELKGVAEDLCSSCDPSIHIEQLTEALRNLVVSVDRSGSRDTAVLCDLDAARAVLGEDGS